MNTSIITSSGLYWEERFTKLAGAQGVGGGAALVPLPLFTAWEAWRTPLRREPSS